LPVSHEEQSQRLSWQVSSLSSFSRPSSFTSVYGDPDDNDYKVNAVLAFLFFRALLGSIILENVFPEFIGIHLIPTKRTKNETLE
jgi:hypothetical protein